MHIYTVLGLPRPCTWMCKVWCWLGMHRWSWPGGYCECCEKSDTFDDGITSL